MQYVKKKYGTVPEYLWAKSPNNGILRHNDNPKWYGALLKVSKQKLGLDGTEDVNILNLKCDPILMGMLIDKKGYFPGYHMNKIHWISVLLDGSVRYDDIFNLIDLSYDMTGEKEKSK